MVGLTDARRADDEFGRPTAGNELASNGSSHDKAWEAGSESEEGVGELHFRKAVMGFGFVVKYGMER